MSSAEYHAKQSSSKRRTLPEKSNGLFVNLCILTGFWWLLELSFFITANINYVKSSALFADSLSFTPQLYRGILHYFIAQLILHISLVITVFFITKGIAKLNLFATHSKQLKLGLVIWTLAIITIITANQFFFPFSIFADLFSVFFINLYTQKFLLGLLLLILMIIILISFYGWCYSYYQSNRQNKFFLALFFILSLSIYILFNFNQENSLLPNTNTITNKQPNIFIIGFDSLRPDVLTYFGGEYDTPALNQFLKQSVIFNEAFTPLARTFPAWVSILTGQYPKTTGIRTNLQNTQGRFFSSALPAILKKKGYQTLFATDETRFSHIDHSFGFEHIIAPPMDVNDFILGTLNDFPLSNLIINTTLGKFLFPNSYANRAVFHTYNPDSFLNLIQSHLSTQINQPLFMAVHFCLPHYPYLYAGLSRNSGSPKAHYAASVMRADKQFKQFIKMLKQLGLLQHAIVIVLSDHGEALELPGDRIIDTDSYIPTSSIPKQLNSALLNSHLALNQSAGHGTDVLSISQYHTLLAFKKFDDKPAWPSKEVSGYVSLVDIKPTILSILNYATNDSNGMLLTTYLEHNINNTSYKRPLFFESDFSPESIRSIYPNINQAIADGVGLFKIDHSNNRLVLKSDRLAMIMHAKQYAILYEHWMLALYPKPKGNYDMYLINLMTGEWTDQYHSSLSKIAPLSFLVTELQQFYQQSFEINNSPHAVY